MESSRYEKSLKRLLTSESTPKLGLARNKSLLKTLGNPEHDYEVFHVAGTNGKGSTCAFLASLLEKSGGPIGLYTSPHLSSARERIRLCGSLIEEDLFCEAEEAVFWAAEKAGEQPTFFERMTAMAFWAFSQAKVAKAVIEVGIGGRLDATNVVNPAVSVITRVDLDHTDILGTTLAEIAFEKAGIIKPRVPVVTGWQLEEAHRVIRSVADNQNAPLKIASTPCEYDLGLQGPHQKQNAAIALEATKAAGISLCELDIAKALKDTAWPGRFELIRENPPVILDGAHNASGMDSLILALEEERWSRFPVVLILGATKGHNPAELAQALSPLSNRLAQIIVTKSKSLRAIPVEELVPLFSCLAPCVATQNLDSAFLEAKKSVNPNVLTVVCGSLFVVGEARSFFVNTPCDPEFPLY